MRRSTWMGLFLFLLSSVLHAENIPSGIPLWVFTPLTSTTGTPGDTIQYRVTSQANRAHTLLVDTPGVSQITTGSGVCQNPFTLQSKGDSCILSLLVDGQNIRRTATGGPSVCQQGSVPNQCYQPSQTDVLTVSPFTLSPNSGPAAGYANVTITGVNLAGTTNITFDGIDAIGFSVVSNTTLTAVTPPHAIGSVDVILEITSGNKESSNAYTYVANVAGDAIAGGQMGCLSGNQPTLIVSPSFSAVPWIGDGTSLIETGTTSHTEGALNTQTIISVFNSQTPPVTLSTYPAGICSTYSIDSQGNTPCAAGSDVCYDNWFLPAIDQLTCLCSDALLTVSNFYWSSTERDVSAALTTIPSSCSDGGQVKSDSFIFSCTQSYPPTYH